MAAGLKYSTIYITKLLQKRWLRAPEGEHFLPLPQLQVICIDFAAWRGPEKVDYAAK